MRPEVVLHAAAHKHVPLMEQNVLEAVANNALGTRDLVRLATAARVRSFVLISTDKAVRPSSVMGATKRVAELVVRDAGRRSARHGARCSVVRFGNVLASRGSVVETFLRQIERGEPLTITHPDVERWFLSIPEASQLVLVAGSLPEPRGLYVLDMGRPRRVVDLACDLARLAGRDAPPRLVSPACGRARSCARSSDLGPPRARPRSRRRARRRGAGAAARGGRRASSRCDARGGGDAAAARRALAHPRVGLASAGRRRRGRRVRRPKRSRSRRSGSVCLRQARGPRLRIPAPPPGTAPHYIWKDLRRLPGLSRRRADDRERAARSRAGADSPSRALVTAERLGR